MLEWLPQTPETVAEADGLRALPIQNRDRAVSVHEKRVGLARQAQPAVKQTYLGAERPQAPALQHSEDREEHFELGRVWRLETSPIEMHLAMPVQKSAARGSYLSAALPMIDNLTLAHLCA